MHKPTDGVTRTERPVKTKVWSQNSIKDRNISYQNSLPRMQNKFGHLLKYKIQSV